MLMWKPKGRSPKKERQELCQGREEPLLRKEGKRKIMHEALPVYAKGKERTSKKKVTDVFILSLNRNGHPIGNCRQNVISTSPE